jgi:hypothetical protein
VNFAAITIRVASQRVFIVYFVIDSVRIHLRKLDEMMEKITS